MTSTTATNTVGRSAIAGLQRYASRFERACYALLRIALGTVLFTMVFLRHSGYRTDRCKIRWRVR